MPRVEYLLIFNALLFGIGSSLYFLSFARIIQENRVKKEWRWFAVALPFFFIGLALWFIDYTNIEAIDHETFDYAFDRHACYHPQLDVVDVKNVIGFDGSVLFLV